MKNRLIGFLATLGLLALVIGLPAVLLAIGDSPVPHGMPTMDGIRDALSSPDDGTLALGVLKVAAWLAWLFLTFAVVVEVVARARGVRAPRLPGLAVPQSAARGMVAAAALLFIAAPAVGTLAAPPASAAATTSLRASTTAASPPASTPTRSQAASPTHAVKQRHDTVEHTVRRGETLWSIAHDHLGAGARFPEITVLNTHLLGENPGFLKPGWTLQLPAARLNGVSSGSRHAETYQVKPGDTLSQIAQDRVGDADAYPAIFTASEQIIQPGGSHLSDPDVIDVGWTLRFPDVTSPPTAGTSTSPSPAPTPPPASAPKSAPRGHTATPRAPAGEPGANPPRDRRAPGEQAPGQQTPQMRASRDAGAPTHGSAPNGSTTRPHSAAAGDQGTGDWAGEETTVTAPWLLAGLTGAGAMLAGSMFLVLRRRRREQFRGRRPGRTVAVPGPVLAPVEKTVMTTGAPAAATVEFMNAVLGRLATTHAAAGASMPALAAVELTEDGLVLHLSRPASLPDPWEDGGDQLHWICATDNDLDQVGPHLEDRPSPYPLLVTIGSADTGETWLLNCEELAVLSITGDPMYAGDFARYLAAELAMNPWSRDVSVDCLGICAEVEPMNPCRIRFHPAGTSAGAALGRLLTDTVSTVDRADAAGLDVASARAVQAGDDLWTSRVLLLDATLAHAPAGDENVDQSVEDVTRDTADDGTAAALEQLLSLVHEQAGRTGTAVVLIGETASPIGVELQLTSHGRVLLPMAGLDLVGVGLTSDEAQGCAALVAHSDDLDDVGIPVDSDAEQGWRAFADEAGALRSEQTLPRHIPVDEILEIDEPVSSVLAGSAEDYLRVTATTREDLETLARHVPARVRSQVEDADPGLDADLDAWFSPDCSLPRLSLLGPVAARTRGQAISKRKAHYTEMLAYLATRPHGATPARLGEAFGLSAGRVRGDVKVVRDWLGINPRTGDKHLPSATESAAAKARGVGVYEVEDLLVDADLFRRLRVRGEARGADGFADLCLALRLVTGKPFDQIRDGGWSWLYESDRIDHHLLVSVLDVAHFVIARALVEKNIERAQSAAELAILIAPHDESVLLDLASVRAAEGHQHEADRIVRDDVCNYSDDGQPPMDLSARSQEIVRRWADRAKAAS